MKMICAVLIISVMCLCVNAITNEHHSALVSAVQKVKELKGEDTRDPPPEYYRGTSSSPTSYDHDRYGNSVKDFITSPGGSRFLPSTPPTTSNYGGNRDRSFGSWSSSSSSNLGNSDGTRYGGYGGNTDRYNSNSGYGGGNRYGYVSGGTYDSTRPTYGPAIPFDTHTYNNPSNTYNIHGTSIYPDFQDPSYEYNSGWNNGYGTPTRGKDLTKKILLPLAGAAILGVAAALVANPVLLQVGVAHGKRKRRDTSVAVEQAQNLAYKGHNTDE